MTKSLPLNIAGIKNGNMWWLFGYNYHVWCRTVLLHYFVELTWHVLTYDVEMW